MAIAEFISAQAVEGQAMAKIVHPYGPPYPLWHRTSLDKLEDILTQGVIAGDFASRVGKMDYRGNYGSSWNKKYVSIERGGFDGGLDEAHSIGSLAVLVFPRDELSPATDDLYQPGDAHFPMEEELLVKNRIAPREIHGIQIHLSDVEVAVAKIMNLGPKYAVPVYTSVGLAWPIKLSKSQLTRWLRNLHL
jgi:hypothetical protein